MEGNGKRTWVTYTGCALLIVSAVTASAALLMGKIDRADYLAILGGAAATFGPVILIGLRRAMTK